MKMIKEVLFTLTALFFSAYSLFANAGDSGRVRLPDIINNYRYTLIPVISNDAKTLYFDRKLHPANTGGLSDEDDIWYSKRLGENSWTAPKILPGINTEKSSVLFSLSPDGRKGLFYGIENDSIVGSKSGFYILSHKNGKWADRINIQIDDFYNMQNRFFGFLSADERALLLALERTDGYGELDLYVSLFDSKTSEWSKPKNLSGKINTAKIEGAPFLAYDNKTLYFISNGLKGNGGLDIFVTKRLDDTWQNWTQPINLGSMLNTKYDENSLYLSALADTVWYSSYDTTEKMPGIYYAKLPEVFKPEPYVILYGNVDSKSSKAELPKEFNIKIEGIEGIHERTVEIDDESKSYLTVFPALGISKIKVFAAGYKEIEFQPSERMPQAPYYQHKNLIFESEQSEGKKLLARVYFDYDSFSISAEEFESMMKELEQNKVTANGALQIIGHTDSAGTDQYNNNLADKRAKAVFKEIKRLKFNTAKAKIISAGRKEPISNDHAKNRRVDIYLVFDKKGK